MAVRAGGSTLIRLPFDPAEVWGPRDRYHVRGLVSGVVCRGPLHLVDGDYCIKLGPAWIRDCGLDLDRELQVEIQIEGPQSDAIAEDIVAAFAGQDEAKRLFDSLPSFYRNNFMRSIDGAKRPETRAKRIADMMAVLKAGKRGP